MEPLPPEGGDPERPGFYLLHLSVFSVSWWYLRSKEKAEKPLAQFTSDISLSLLNNILNFLMFTTDGRLQNFIKVQTKGLIFPKQRACRDRIKQFRISNYQ